MSDEDTALVPIPGGEMLLKNVTQTGETLMHSAKTVKDFGHVISKEQMILIIAGHGKIGEVMVSAVERARRKMGDGVPQC